MIEEYVAQLNEQQVSLMNNLIDLAKIVLPALITLLSAYLAYRFANRQAKYRKQLEFIERKVVEFYSPMLGCIRKIQAHAELRAELSQAANNAWQKICEEAGRPFHDHKERFEPFKKITEFDNEKLTAEIIPLYDQMVSIFTQNYWLAEDSTKAYYKDLCRFVDIWHRYLKDSIPYEVFEEIEYRENVLFPLYEDLENQTITLRNILANK